MLSPGTRFGPYEIATRIGAGGMGEVYRARDTRLDRAVAIKILPESVAGDPEAQGRFEREARAIAALDHPHICAVFDVGRQDGTSYLVMQHLEGETLAARLARTKQPLTVDEALTIAIALADALDKTHRAGIVHRDVKPGNVMLTRSGAKLLGFGIAKLVGAAAPLVVSGETGSSTAMPGTSRGTVLGTIEYMPPEQLEGREADTRSDVWAFGVVLFEMLTGLRPFRGESPASTIGAILRDQPPPVSTQKATVPPAFDHLVSRCLEKDPDDRWQNIGDVKLQLLALRANAAIGSRVAPDAPGHPWRRVAAVAGGAALLAAMAAVLLTRWVMTPPTGATGSTPVSVALELGSDASLAGDFPTMALSPDSTRIVYVSTDAQGVGRLSVRRLDQPGATPLPGTEGAYTPFFSPDGRAVGFFAGGKLKKVLFDGSAPVVLCDAPAGRGASWGEDGRIVAALDNRAGLSLVAADGGEVTRATELSSGELTHRLPQFLPGGKAVVFLISSAPGSYAAASMAVATLGTEPARARVILPNVGMAPRYLPTGHLTYVANGTVFALPFDVASLEVRGAAVPVLDDVSSSVGFGWAQWEASAAGDALYRGGRTTGRTVVEWVKADGSTESLWPEPAFYQFPHLAPDGKRLLAVRADGVNSDIWVYDIERGTKTRLTSGSGVNSYPIWSADSRHIVFQLGGQLHWVSADGAERPKPLLTTAAPAFPSSFTPDGARLLFYEVKPEGGSMLATVPVTRDGTGLKVGAPQPYREVSAGNPVPTFSPDGRWVALASIESGVYEVYVRAFPDTGRQWAVSTGGGSFPVWSRTSSELFYRTEDQFVMSVAYKVAGDAFVPDKPRRWSDKRLFSTGLIENFDVAPDGTRIAGLMAEPQGLVTQRHATLVVNFFDQVRRRMAGGSQ